jgi:hypothetical protein
VPAPAFGQREQMPWTNPYPAATDDLEALLRSRAFEVLDRTP